MVGRDDELNQLLAAFARMQRGRAQLVSLVGEAGTGKTRLIAEFLSRLAADGQLEHIALRRAAGFSLGQPTYGVFGTIFRELMTSAPRNSLETARQKLAVGLQALDAKPEVAETVTPVLRYVLGLEDTRAHDLQPEQLKRQIALAARTLLERRLQQLPVLFVVEDLHWADTASVDLLRDLADQLADRRLMMLLSHRPEMKAPLLTRAGQSIIRLAPLSVAESRTLVGGLFGQVAAVPLASCRTSSSPAPVAIRCSSRRLCVGCWGVACWCARLIAGYARRWATRWTSPRPCRGCCCRALTGCRARFAALLQEAAVLGPRSRSNFCAPSPAESGGMDAALERLIEADLIQPTGRGLEGNRYRFTNTLLHEVVYQNLLLSRRIELHETSRSRTGTGGWPAAASA